MKTHFWVPRITPIVTVTVLLLSACGGSSAPRTTSTIRTSGASSIHLAAPSNAAAQAYVTALIPRYENELKAKGADLFGTISVQCAATGGPETECLVQIPYRTRAWQTATSNPAGPDPVSDARSLEHAAASTSY
jgi:hypothetical protein